MLEAILMRDDDGDEENNLRVARESLDRMMCLVRVGKGDRILKTPTNAKFMGASELVIGQDFRQYTFLSATELLSSRRSSNAHMIYGKALFSCDSSQHPSLILSFPSVTNAS
ncbi:MAG: hypothetical protein Q9206_006020 [Seirophora lacunosa]